MRVFVALLILMTLAAPAAAESRFKVIVHPDNPSESVSRDFLSAAYLKKTTEWHGETIKPIDLEKKFREREQFTRHVIRKSPAQLRTYWNQRVFSGKGVPPPEAESIDEVVAYVVSHPGAVGYVPEDADVKTAKVVPIR